MTVVLNFSANSAFARNYSGLSRKIREWASVFHVMESSNKTDEKNRVHYWMSCFYYYRNCRCQNNSLYTVHISLERALSLRTNLSLYPIMWAHTFYWSLSWLVVHVCSLFFKISFLKKIQANVGSTILFYHLKKGSKQKRNLFCNILP